MESTMNVVLQECIVIGSMLFIECLFLFLEAVFIAHF